MLKPEDKTILVVDDEDDVRNYLKTALEDAGFKVNTATNGKEAMQEVEKDRPDMISLDLVMPGHSGFEFYKNLQKHKEYKNIPILIVTGHAHDELGKVDFEKMTMQGPGVYLEKPVKPKQYVQSVCKILDVEVPEEMKSVKPDPDKLRSELQQNLDNADPEALQRALDALKKNK